MAKSLTTFPYPRIPTYLPPLPSAKSIIDQLTQGATNRPGSAEPALAAAVSWDESCGKVGGTYSIKISI
jgi:hypothetical protein